MRTFAHLLLRELRDQRFVLLAAPLLGLLPGLMVKLAIVPDAAAEDSRRWLARLLFYGVLLAASAVVGSRWLLAGFADRRRGFELARPLGAGQLWASKLAAGLALVFGVAALVGLPSGGEIWRPAPWVDAEILGRLGDGPLVGLLGDFVTQTAARPAGAGWPLMLVLVALVVLVTAQSLAFLLAARTWRSLADLAAWVVAGLLFASIWLLFDHFGVAGSLLGWLAPFAMALPALGALAAWRSFGGGVLLRESHRRYSLVMSLGIVALGLAAVGSARHVLVARPDRLPLFGFAVPSADGAFWLIGMPMHGGFAPAFRVAAATGQATYLLSSNAIEGRPWLSADGGRAVLARTGAGPGHLEVFDFAAEGGLAGEDAVSGLEDQLPWRIDGAGERFVLSWPRRGAAGVYRVGGKPLLVEDPALAGDDVVVVPRGGSSFDLLVRRPGQIRRIGFDAASGELRPGPTFPVQGAAPQLADPLWWQGALPLLDAGFPYAALAASPRVLPLQGGYGLVARDGDPPSGRAAVWQVIDADGRVFGSFAAPRAVPVGEIRPGLLLAWEPRTDLVPRRLFEFLQAIFPGDFRTLVIETPSGRIRRRLAGWAPAKNPVGERVWLVDRFGEPADLDAADAEPKLILPFRPFLATEGAR